jgi:hypothetical protein
MKSDVSKKAITVILTVQTTYSLVTALWGLVDIESFMKVTGPKTDIWLVKTVSALLVCTSFFFISVVLRREFSFSVFLLAYMQAFALAVIDFYYALNGTISIVYIADGILEIIFVVFWSYVMSLKESAPLNPSEDKRVPDLPVH